ncbi:MAG TPA: hypothetical protein VL172_21670 [Kofleriaceae bacterium]|nr:hypothetical protein [Kofleriaceae bacterium]
MKRELAITWVLLAVTAGPAAAEPTVPAPPAPRVLNVPTAHLQGSGRLFLTAGGSAVPERDPFAAITFGLGGLADVDVEMHDRVGNCADCTGDRRAAASIATVTGGFKVGLPEGRLATWQPALALGLRAPIGSRTIAGAGGDRQLRAARMTLMASRTLRPLELHAGAEIWDAAASGPGGDVFLHERSLGARVRPYLGLAWNPPIYPRTRLLVDGSFAPVVDGDTIALRWMLDWGVRYQVTRWGSVELDVRHREGDRLGDTDVLIRANAAVDLLRGR